MNINTTKTTTMTMVNGAANNRFMNHKLVLMRGCPGSGKSSFIRESGLEDFVLCPDTLRLMFRAPELDNNGVMGISQADNGVVFGAMYQMLENRMKYGSLSIIDATHCSGSQFHKEQMDNYRSLAEKYGYTVYWIEPEILPLDEYIERNTRRGYRDVPAHVVEIMYNNWVGIPMPDDFIKLESLSGIITPTMEEPANRVLAILNDAGYEAYIVGGAVRDKVMGKEPHDYDIATSATPEEVMAIMPANGYEVVNTSGIEFGVVVVSDGENEFEIATFRTEWYGDDGRKPDGVIFQTSLKEDVKRRDLTINGLAMNKDGEIIDLVGGIDDIRNGIVKAVGNPAERFAEDALRMMRVFRFAARYGFAIDEETLDGISPNLELLAKVSRDRVLKELEGILLSEKPSRGLEPMVLSGVAAQSCRRTLSGVDHKIAILPELMPMVGLKQNLAHHKYDVLGHTMAVVDAAEADLVLRWAALLHDVGKAAEGIVGEKDGQPTFYKHDLKSVEIAEEILARLGYKDKFIYLVSWLCQKHMVFHTYVGRAEKDLRKWIVKEARNSSFRSNAELVEAFTHLGKLGVADVIGGGVYDKTSSVTLAEDLVRVAATVPVHTKDLNYSKELPNMTGKHTKEVLTSLLERVQNGQLENNEDVLMEAAIKRLARLQ